MSICITLSQQIKILFIKQTKDNLRKNYFLDKNRKFKISRDILLNHDIYKLIKQISLQSVLY